MTNITSPEDPGMAAAAAVHVSAEAPVKYSDGYVRYALWLLFIIYVFNFLDRQLLSILASDIKLDLKISDTQFGLLAGIAFAFFYTFMGIPIARFAETKNRPFIMATSLTVWSGFTALSGSAQNFLQLTLYRIGVGVGEAGGTPPAHSLITDYVPKEKRASALAFYSMGVPVGSLAGLAAGGLLADAFGWRWAFVLCGVPGIILAIITFTTLKETRRKMDKDLARIRTKNPATFWQVLTTLFSKPTFWLIAVGASLKSFIGYGQSSFHPVFYQRNHAEEVNQMAAYFGMEQRGFLGIVLGLLVGVFGVISTLMGGWMADKLAKKDPRNATLPPAIAVLATIPVYIWAIVVDSAFWSFIGLIIPYLLNYVWYGPVYATTQGIVPPHMRATTAAILLFIINMVGLGLGPLLVGFVSDTVANTHMPAGLSVNVCKEMGRAAVEGCAAPIAIGVRQALIICSFAGVPSFILFMLARRTIVKDLEG